MSVDSQEPKKLSIHPDEEPSEDVARMVEGKGLDHVGMEPKVDKKELDTKELREEVNLLLEQIDAFRVNHPDMDITKNTDMTLIRGSVSKIKSMIESAE